MVNKFTTVVQVREKIKNKAKDAEFISTGFTKLDNNLDGGFMRRELIVLGAFTGVGKSYLAGQWLYGVAKQGFSAAYFSLEISSEMVVSRIVGSLSNIKPTRITAGLLTDIESKEKEKNFAKVAAHNELLSFYDELYDYRDIAAEIKKNKYEFVVIDFIQNVLVKGQGDEYSRLSWLAVELQRLAKETNCCILVTSQLSNTKAKEGAKGGNIEYKGSGAIAMVCDLGFIVERDSVEGENINTNGVRLYLKKNRRGTSGMEYHLLFTPPGGMLTQTNYERQTT